MNMFKALINEDYSVNADTDWYQSTLEHKLSKVDFDLTEERWYDIQQNFNKQHKHKHWL